MKFSSNTLFVLGLSLIPLIKKGTNSEEIGYLEILKSYLDRSFVYNKRLPMSHLVDYLILKLAHFNTINLHPFIFLKITRLVQYLIIACLISKSFSREENKKTKGKLAILFTISPIILSRAFSTYNVGFVDLNTLFFSSSAIFTFFSGFYFIASVLVGLAVSCNWSALCIILILQTVNFYNFYLDIIDKNKKVISTILRTFKKVLFLTIIPIIIYLISFWISYSIRNVYNPSLDRFSLEFQSSFHNGNQEKCDKVVYSDSIITLINQRYKLFLSVEKKGDDEFRILSTKILDENCLWVVKKVEDDDEPIKHGEKVRLIHYLHEKALALNKVDNKSKFFDLELSEESSVRESENEIFKFEILKPKNQLEARSTLFKLTNTNTGMDLCARKLKKKKGVTGSAEMSHYSNKINRAYYIADNKATTQQTEFATTYPKLSFFEVFLEHHFHLFADRSTKFFEFSYRLTVENLKTLLLLSIPFFLICNFVLINRYERGYHLTDKFIFFYILHLLCGFFSYIFMNDVLLKDVIDSMTSILFLSLFDRRLLLGYNLLAMVSFVLHV